MASDVPAPAPPAQPAVPHHETWTFIVYGMKHGQEVQFRGSIVVPNVMSAVDTIRLLVEKDPRITKAMVSDPKSGEIVWAVFPGPVKTQMERGGFGPDLILPTTMDRIRG